MSSTKRDEEARALLAQSSRGHPAIPVLVRDLMTDDPVTVEPTATVKEIAEILLRRDIRAVPVVDVGDQLVGMVSEADLIARECLPASRRHRSAGDPEWEARVAGLTAGELLSPELVSADPDEAVAVAARRMLRHDVRTLPVVVDGRLVGIISRHDLLRLFDRPDPEIRQDVIGLLADPWWAPTRAPVRVEVRDGVVVLDGAVRHRRDAALVVDLVAMIPGVTEVVDRLTWETERS